jgi:hypothetical protein
MIFAFLGLAPNRGGIKKWISELGSGFTPILQPFLYLLSPQGLVTPAKAGIAPRYEGQKNQ